MPGDEYFASGGVISWPVSGRKDDVPVVLTGCEYIIPRRAAREWLRTLRLDYLFDPRD